MNCLRRSTRWVHALPRSPNQWYPLNVKAGGQFGLQFRRSLATHDPAAGSELAGEARSVTKVEKILLDTIKVGYLHRRKCSVV